MTQQARVLSWGNFLGKGETKGTESGDIDASDEKDRGWVELPQTKSIIEAVFARMQTLKVETAYWSQFDHDLLILHSFRAASLDAQPSRGSAPATRNREAKPWAASHTLHHS
jgi:hypothetical protein